MMQTVWKDNFVLLRGQVVAAPCRSHENHGVVYQSFPLEVRRLSGASDQLNIVVPESLLVSSGVLPGQRLEILGEVRSYNNKSGLGSRLVITVYARTLSPSEEPDENLVTLTGSLCKAATLRRTPLGRDICDMMLAVNRRYGRADYLPCISWGALARQCGELCVGEQIRLRGRLQSRTYTKQLPDGPQQRVAFEISVMELEE